MSTSKFNVFLFALAFLTMHSCKCSGENDLSLSNDLPNLTVYLPNTLKDSIIKLYPAIYLKDGELCTITRKSYGCFTSIDETIMVEKNKGNYKVSLKQSDEGQDKFLLFRKDFDSTFTDALISFMRYYQFGLPHYEIRENRDSFYFGTVNSLSIQKGTQPVLLQNVSYEDLTGYIALIKTINPYQKN